MRRPRGTRLRPERFASGHGGANLEQGHAGQRQREAEREDAVAHRDGLVRLEALELLASLDRAQVALGRILRRAERAPDRVAVAVRAVDPPMAHPGAAAERQAL